MKNTNANAKKKSPRMEGKKLMWAVESTIVSPVYLRLRKDGCPDLRGAAGKKVFSTREDAIAWAERAQRERQDTTAASTQPALWAGANATAMAVTIRDGVTEIPPRAFRGNKAIVSVTLPNSVTKIGAEAFAGCTRPCLKNKSCTTLEFAVR